VLTGPAKETLNALSTQAPFDLVFIDADKESYPDYFRFAEKHLRRGGLLIADNALVFGNIADEKFDDPELGRMAEGVREFNRLVTTSEHFRATILPTGDGMVLAVKTR
jgi:predicted O-methyltransferase YrrM